jgi:hypothetical protein
MKVEQQEKGSIDRFLYKFEQLKHVNVHSDYDDELNEHAHDIHSSIRVELEVSAMKPHASKYYSSK